MHINVKVRNRKSIYYSLVSIFLVVACTVPVSTSRKVNSSEPAIPTVQTHSEKSNLAPLDSDKKRLHVSHPTQDSLTIALPPFSLKGELQNDVTFSLPLTLPISRSNIKEGTGEVQLSKGTESWNASQLVTAYFSLFPQDNGSLDIRFNAGKYAGSTTYYINAKGSISGDFSLKDGTTLLADIDTETSQYSISNDNSGGAGSYKFESGQLQVQLNGEQLTVTLLGITSSQLTKFDCYSWGTGSACYDVSDPNKKLIDGEINFVVPVNQHELSLALKASQDKIGNTASDTQGHLITESTLSIDSFLSQKPWTLRVKKEGSEGSATGDSCWETHTSQGTGSKDEVLKLDASKLGNGSYKVEAYYTDYPNEKASLTVKVDNEGKIYAEPASFNVGEESTTITTFVPPCMGDGEILLSGQAWKLIDPTAGRFCTHPAISVGHGQKTTNWGGVCEDLIGNGTWDAQLISTENGVSKMIAQTTLDLKYEIVVSPSPTPTSEPTVGPTVEPSSGPSTSPTPSVNPSVQPSVNPSATSTPSVEPTATPTPSATPTPTPTPTPNKEDDCLSRNAGRDGTSEALWRWFPGDPDSSQPEECYLPPFRMSVEHEIETDRRPECELLVSAADQESCQDDTPITFAPKDRNGFFDKLKFSVQAEPTALWKLDIQKDSFSTLDDLNYRQFGNADLIWDGFIGENLCVKDGQGVVRLVDKHNLLVQEIPFQVDNTPPQIVSGSTINTVKVSEDPERFQTDVVVNLMDFAGGLSEESLNLRIFVEGVGEIQTKTVTRDGSMVSVSFRFYANADQRYIHMLYEDVLHNIASVNVNQ